MDEAVLEALLSFMYGKLTEIPDELLIPLFMAADSHQVSYSLLVLQLRGGVSKHVLDVQAFFPCLVASTLLDGNVW